MALDNRVIYKELTKDQYKNIIDKNINTLYFCTDTAELFKGEDLYSGNVKFVEQLPTTMDNVTLGCLYFTKDGTASMSILNSDGNKDWAAITISPSTEILDGNISYNTATIEAIKIYVNRKIKEAKPEIKMEDLKIPKDIIVKGATLGSYKDGEIIPKDTPLIELITKMFAKQIPPTYSNPIFSLTSVPTNLNYEVGTKLSPTINASFIQKDAGIMTNYTLTKTYDGIDTELLNSTEISSISETDQIIKEGNSLIYTAIAAYEQGPIKRDNLWEDYPIGRIEAGNVKKTITFVGKRNTFYGVLNEIKDINSANIRNLPGKSLGLNNGAVFDLNIPVGCKQIIIAYPSTLRDISYIISSSLNLDVKSTFVKSEVQVDGANELDPTTYKVFVYTPSIPFTSTDTYKVTI